MGVIYRKIKIRSLHSAVTIVTEGFRRSVKKGESHFYRTRLLRNLLLHSFRGLNEVPLNKDGTTDPTD